MSVELPTSIRKVIDRGVSELSPERIVLFGSRARGDATPTSDYDLAFFGVQDLASWREFAADMIYEPPSLFRLDVLRFEAAPEELQESIRRDGKVVYRSESR